MRLHTATNLYLKMKRASTRAKQSLEMKMEQRGKLLIFTRGSCKIIYNTSGMAWVIQDFNCGDRGRGKGKKLFTDSLKYIHTTYGRKGPFRIELQAVPSGSNSSSNDQTKLDSYYTSLGFMPDMSSYGSMFAMFDDLIKKHKGGTRRR